MESNTADAKFIPCVVNLLAFAMESVKKRNAADDKSNRNGEWNMKFQTTDELTHYDFEEAVLNRVEAANGRVKLAMDNVTILPENTCNRDIRKMRANDFYLILRRDSLSVW